MLFILDCEIVNDALSKRRFLWNNSNLHIIIRETCFNFDILVLYTYLNFNYNRKIFESLMSSFTITVDNIFKFADLRFQRSSLAVQQQALRWLRLLTQLQITVPVTLLLKILANGLLAFSPLTPNQSHQRVASSTSFGLVAASPSASADLMSSQQSSAMSSPLLVRLSRRGLVPATVSQLQLQLQTSLQRGHEILDALDADGLIVVDSLLHRELLQCSQLERDDLIVFHYGSILQLLLDQVNRFNTSANTTWLIHSYYSFCLLFSYGN